MWQYQVFRIVLQSYACDSFCQASPDFEPTHASNLSRPPLAKMIHDLSEGLIGEVVDIVTRTAVAAVESGEERITSSTVMALGYVPLSRRRNSALRHSMT